jgi:hypothetical protein
MKKIVDFFLSLKLTVTLLALSMVLVFAGTLAQVDKGIWTVVDQYFRCFIAWIDLPVFFPRTWDIPNLKLPFPGGFLIGWLMVVNLITVHWASFKIQARGGRLIGGLVLLLLGVLVTCGVMFGWGTAPVANDQSDAFWRVFLRLGRGTLAAVVLYLACVALYRKRAGMVLLHAGILFLMVGEFITALYAVEATMTIKEGETVNYVDHSQQIELAFIDQSDPAFDRVVVIPERKLKAGAVVAQPDLPFDVRVNKLMANSTQPRALETIPEAMKASYPKDYEGYGSRLYVAEAPENSGASGGRNAPAIDIDLLDRATGKSIGRYVLSLWFYPNFVNRSWDMPQTVVADGKTLTAYLRSRREYLATPDGNPFSIKLLDFVHEKYEGTQMPKDFASQIVLVNQNENVERELRIWMNNPLRYARRTFYQSGYLPGDGGTVLQVVRNDSWMIPYLACMIVFTGMAAQFVQSLRRSQRRDS